MQAHYYCLEDPAFHALIDEVTSRVVAAYNKKPDKWISAEEAMKMLRITSKTSLQKLRDEGKVKFSNPLAKGFLYDTESILAFIEKNAHNTF
jgi:helix-turn-helix protein